MCMEEGSFVVFGLLRHDLVGSVPLGLEPFCLGILFVDGGGYGVHRVNVTHECRVEFLSEKGDKDSLVNYPTEMGSDFEFIHIGEDFVLDLGDGLEAGKSFCLEVSDKEGFSKGGFEVGEGPELLVIDGIRSEGCCPS